IIWLNPLKKIHLYSHTGNEIEANGDIKYIYIFGALAAFILILACVNFINLATATSSRRAREVGIRKAMGSLRLELIQQFLSESIFLAFGALVIAYGFVTLLLPYFNSLTAKTLSFAYFFQPSILVVTILAVVFVGVVAGIYPSFFLSAFH